MDKQSERIIAKFDAMRSERFFRTVSHRIPVGIQWSVASNIVVTELVEAIRLGLEDSGIFVSLRYSADRTKRAIGIGIKTDSGTNQTLRFEIKASLVNFARKSQFIGSPGGVMALGLLMVDEIQRVVQSDAKFSQRGDYSGDYRV